MSAIKTLGQMFTEPGKAFEAVQERSMIALPLILTIVGTLALWAWYYQVVDVNWLIDQMVAAQPDMEPAQAESMRKMMNPTMLTVFTAVGVVIMMPLILLISATYYTLSAKVIGSEIGFGKWFALSTWSMVPALLLIPAGAIKILMTSNGQLTQEQLNPLSLNQLFFHLPASDAWAGLLSSIHLPMFWSLFLAFVGYKLWTRKSSATAWTVVLLPYVLIYGIWALVAMSKGGA
ncbi:YIP1 family protein [Pseudomarimonas arenosa]|uniref:YIP1 family protein n=1 Tax=Pseudomarimonas arenosa TaxID=2774145 RepID=A0AAW3ZDN6_9GAMM|nr:YIP1 family protein [Pseudomarimonas arenosa]MBD8524296.1 YIP1 family protein [Pseudomarimonas arenosa]